MHMHRASGEGHDPELLSTLRTWQQRSHKSNRNLIDGVEDVEWDRWLTERERY